MKLTKVSRAAATLGPAVVVLVFGILVHASTQRAERSKARVDATYAVRAQLDDLFSRIIDAEAAQREFLLRGEEELLEPYRRSEQQIARSLDSLRKLVDETQRPRLPELESLVAERLFHLEHGIEVRRKTGAETAQSIVLGSRETAVMHEIRRKIEDLDQVQAKLLMQRQGAELRQARLSRVAVVAGTILAALMALLTNVILTRYATRHERATRDVARTNEQLAAQTRDLAAANAQLQKTAHELEQQTEAFAERSRLATLNAEIGYALTHSSSMEVMLQRATVAVVTRMEAAFARIWTMNEKDQILELQASAGLYTHLDGPHGRVPVGSLKIGNIAAEKKPHLTNNVLDDPRVSDHEWARREGMVAFAGYPLLLDGELLGVMALFSRRELTDADFQALALAAGGVALGIQRRRADVELGRLLAEAQAARAEAERANMAKSEFLAMMSHE
ncbi:MAG: CHASE3 domain-containing protein, partial [Gemmatimonadaceae bacterium]